MILLGEAFYSCSESLNLSLKGGGAQFIPLMVIGGCHQTSKYHATFCPGRSSMAYFQSTIPIYGANWWSRKLSVSYTVPMCSRQNLHNIEKEEDLTESTSVVLTKYPSKVKLENSSQLQGTRTGVNYVYLVFESLGFYNSRELTPISWTERTFLLKKIIFNVHILQDSSHIGTSLSGAIVGRKIFPFKILWSLLKPYGCHMASISIGLGPMYLEPVHIGGPSVMWSLCPIP